jgi:hypothetical protein
VPLVTVQISIEVWRDSADDGIAQIFTDGVRTEGVIIIPGDCLDLELEDNQAVSFCANRGGADDVGS